MNFASKSFWVCYVASDIGKTVGVYERGVTRLSSDCLIFSVENVPQEKPSSTGLCIRLPCHEGRIQGVRFCVVLVSPKGLTRHSDWRL